MKLPYWWEVTTPHKDIREGIKEGGIKASFAADLGDVVNGKASLEYQDPISFFQRTYLTDGLKNLLKNVLSRLSGGNGDPVIQLQTPFGGGKTHALLALYHIVKNREQVKHLDIVSELPEIKDAKVVVFVGTQPDPIRGRTPWGEIANQLGVYEKVKEHDEKRVSPGKEVLSGVLGEKPVLILIDELVAYAVAAKDFADQISVFAQELTEVVRAKTNCCLVCTLPSSAPYGEQGERALSELQKIFGRVEALYTPVEGVEIYEVIRKRLFEDIGEEKIRKKVAQSYFDIYQKLGTDVPGEVRDIKYRERIEHAYPFHPELIDALYHRWGSYPNFQRTRGVLRLLAEVVKELYKKKVPAPLIQSSLVYLDNPLIRDELIQHIGKEYRSVISADISGNASEIDMEMGSEYEKYRIASGIATSVFLYSFSGTSDEEKKRMSLPEIRVALLRNGIPPTIVGDAIKKLEDKLWYFHSKGNHYAFRNQPNLLRIIVDKEGNITEEQIQEEFEENLKKNAGSSIEVYIWPKDASDIPDTKNLKLAILAPEFTYESEKGKKLASELFDKAGTGFRVYKNTLFIITMGNTDYVSLRNFLKRYLALKETRKEENLPKESQEQLKNMLKDAEKDMPFTILTAYRYLALLEEKGMAWKDLGIPTIGASGDISHRVKDYLKQQEKILYRLTPKYIIEKAFGKDDVEKGVREIYELFLKVPGMPVPEGENVVFEAIKEGVKSGIFGLKEDVEVYSRQEVTPTMDSVVVRGEVVKKKEEQIEKREETGGPEVVREIKGDEGIEGYMKKGPEPQKGLAKKVYIRAKIPWDKLSSIINGVINPLTKEHPPEITIEIKAESKDGFDETTLETRVKETLRQINAEIEVFKPE